jgi:hypothetical protein
MNDSAPESAWGEANHFGDDTDQRTLAQIMHSMRWSGGGTSLHFSLTGLNRAAAHQLQLLFVEKCCDRGFDIRVNDSLRLPRFSPRQITGDDLTKGVVVRLLVEPGFSQIDVHLEGDATFFPDPSPVIQAATLEEFPEAGEIDPAQGPAPSELSIRRSTTAVTLEWNAHPEFLYAVEYAEVLAPGRWVIIASNLESQGEKLTFRDTHFVRRIKPTGFYRLRIEANPDG